MNRLSCLTLKSLLQSHDSNRPVLSCLLPVFQNKSLCEVIHVLNMSSAHRFVFMKSNLLVFSWERFLQRRVLQQRHKVVQKLPISYDSYSCIIAFVIFYFIYFDMLFYLDIAFWMAGKTLEAVICTLYLQSYIWLVFPCRDNQKINYFK